MALASFSVFLFAVVAQTAGNPSRLKPESALVVLSDTGQTRDGLPVLVAHPDAGRYDTALSRGYAGRVVRLYERAQRFARPGVPARPAYLALTDNQGGFPRVGFFLDRPAREAPYIDLHRRSTLSGRPGAVDQIFPHELLHVIVAVLAGEAPEGHATQVHAVGVRTDRITAFNEGFAEHGQVMAIDDPDAPPETRALAADATATERAFARFDDYRRAMTARWSVAPKARMIFPVWFSQSEQVLRYHAVRENLFAREPDVPARLLTSADADRALMLENALPGRPSDPPKPAARLLATEGVVSALFTRIVRDRAVQSNRQSAEFYESFGATAEAVDGLDNAYLKVFAAIRKGGYDALGVVRAHEALFPADAPALEAILKEILVNPPAAAPAELWLLNEAFTPGATLFDQFRGAPVAHAFDLNAASPADLAGVAGVDRQLAKAITLAAPFARVEDLQRVPGVRPDVLTRFQQMRTAMMKPPAPGTEREGRLTFRAVLMPYAWRGLFVWLGCALAAGVLYRALRPAKPWRLAANGLAASLVGLLAGWTVDSGNGVLAFAAPILLFGVTGAAIRLWRSRSPRDAAIVLGAWASAAVAAALTVVPIG